MGVGCPQELPSSCHNTGHKRSRVKPSVTSSPQRHLELKMNTHLPHHVLGAVRRVLEECGVDGPKQSEDAVSTRGPPTTSLYGPCTPVVLTAAPTTSLPDFRLFVTK